MINFLKAIALILIFSYGTSFAQKIEVKKIEPPNWWVGMNSDTVQLMVYGNNLDGLSASFNTPNLKVLKVHDAESSSYSFIDVLCDKKLECGKYNLTLTKGKDSYTLTYNFEARKPKTGRFAGFSSNDAIYLIMPDRFSDGDTTNNVVENYFNQYDRSSYRGRHGGDIKGVINHLDYIKDLGFTTVWLTPVVDNNVNFLSYHGYQATDFYNVDKRMGTNELYATFVEKAHSLGLKVILDHVANHIDINHPWMKNLPFADWVNGTPSNYLQPAHQKMVFTDPHSDSTTANQVQRGWFASYMPDLNQQNPFMANYIIQNTIWWMEYTGLDGVREDTYPYCDQAFMAKWAKRILDEYPSTNIVGEVWTGDAAFLSGYQKGNLKGKGYDTYLPSVTDFGIRDIYAMYLGGQRGLNDVYDEFAKDFLFTDYNNLVTFVDNHDVPRAMFLAKENVAKVKNAYAMLFTTRGIPQVLYASEIGMVGTDDHGYLRGEFRGGFPGDNNSAFTNEGRTEKENDLYNYMHKLLLLRKEFAALRLGKMIQFPPVDNIYTYFRLLDSEKIVVSVNESKKDFQLNLSIYPNQTKGVVKATDLFSGKVYDISKGEKPEVKQGCTGIFLLQ